MKKSKKKNAGLRFIIILLLVIIVVLLVLAIVNGQGEPDFSFLTAGGGDETVDAADVFYFESGRARVCAEVTDGFAVASTTGLHVFDKDGNETTDTTLLFSHPAVTAAGKYGAAYDIGGTYLYVFTADGLVWSAATESEIVSCTINSAGYLSVITGEGGYKSSLTVYDAEGTAVYKWYSGEGYALYGSVEGEGNELCAVAITADGSQVSFFDLTRENVRASSGLTGAIALECEYSGGDSALVMTTTGLWHVDSGEGGVIYDFAGKQLSNYSMSGDGYSVLALLDYSVGSTGCIVSVSDSGDVLGEMQTVRKATSISSNGNLTAVLWPDMLTVYDKQLNEVKSFDIPAGADSVIMRDDGCAMVVASSYALVYDTGR